jgi:hypothetical protein
MHILASLYFSLSFFLSFSLSFSLPPSMFHLSISLSFSLFLFISISLSLTMSISEIGPMLRTCMLISTLSESPRKVTFNYDPKTVGFFQLSICDISHVYCKITSFSALPPTPSHDQRYVRCILLVSPDKEIKKRHLFTLSLGNEIKRNQTRLNISPMYNGRSTRI